MTSSLSNLDQSPRLFFKPSPFLDPATTTAMMFAKVNSRNSGPTVRAPTPNNSVGSDLHRYNGNRAEVTSSAATQAYPVKTRDLSAEPTASSVVKLLPGGFASVNSGTPFRQCRPCLPLFSPPRMTSQARPSLPIPVTYPSPRMNSGFLFVYFTKILEK